MIKGSLVDPASGQAASIKEPGDLLVSDLGLPRSGQKLSAIPLSSFFVDSAGSQDMVVNGSVTPVEFTIDAMPFRDCYIKTIGFNILDMGATLGSFGNIAALTNGVLFEWETLGETVELGVFKTNYDMVRLAGGQPAFGDSTTAFRAANVVGNIDAFMPMLDFATIFGLPWGVLLAGDTKQKLRITIRDDISAIDGFDIQARGFELLPVEGG